MVIIYCKFEENWSRHSGLIAKLNIWLLILTFDLGVKVKSQNQRSNIKFSDQSWMAWSIWLKFAPYNNHIKLNKKTKLIFHDLGVKVMKINPPTLFFCIYGPNLLGLAIGILDQICMVQNRFSHLRKNWILPSQQQEEAEEEQQQRLQSYDCSPL